MGAGHLPLRTRRLDHGYGVGCRRHFASMDSSLHRLACRNIPRPLLQLRRGHLTCAYGSQSALPIASWPRQCRKGWPKALQATSAAGSGRPYNERKGVIRGQAVGLARRPGQIMGVGLGATGRRGISRLGIDPLSIAGPLAVVFGRDIDAMPMAGQLLHGERRGAHSAGNTRS